MLLENHVSRGLSVQHDDILTISDESAPSRLEP